MQHGEWIEKLASQGRTCPECGAGTLLEPTQNPEAVYERCVCGYAATLLSPAGEAAKAEAGEVERRRLAMRDAKRYSADAGAGMVFAEDGNVVHVGFRDR